MKDDVLVSISDVSFVYNSEPVLEHITLDVKKGEFLGVIGPNGSGKTTLLKIIVGLIKPTSGRVTLFGTDPTNFHDRSKMGYVPQRAGQNLFNFPITVEEIVSMGITSNKVKKGDPIREALNAVEMHKYRNRLIGELSGGQQQRVFIARALIGNPELLILDEPTVGVDSEAQAAFYELLQKLNKKMNLTLVLVSHDIDVVAKEVTTIACLNGTLICHVPPKEFMKKDYLEKVYGKNLGFVVHNH